MNAALAPKGGLIAALVGTILVALCCFTPLLVIVLAAAGLSALTPWLDVVLLPALVVMIIVTVISYRRWRAQARQIATADVEDTR